MNHPVLWQFTASHYNEKARWALDWKGVAHVRQSLLPGPHALTTPAVNARAGNESAGF